MYNKFIAVGYLTRDVELRYLPNGTAIANFGIATNYKYGSDRQETFFGEVIAWGKLGEHCNNYLRKGSRILIEGRLVTDSWEYGGQKKQKTRIIAEHVKFFDAKKNEQNIEEGVAEMSYDMTQPEEETYLEPF